MNDCLFNLLYYDEEHSRNTALSRIGLGEMLAQWCPTDADFVVPVPETAILFAQGYSLESGIPLLHALLKKRPKLKTLFIDDREKTIDDIFFSIPEMIKGKRVVIIDEMVISGLSLKAVLEKVKEAGPNKIHVRIVAPPMMRPCPYYCDRKWDDLITGNYCEFFGVDSFCYLPIEELGWDQKCSYCYGGWSRDALE
jgi:amidophosphoribosyltransferase